MKKRVQIFLCLISIAAVCGCGVKRPTSLFEAPDLAMKLNSGEYTQKVDNFLILMDVSHTMRDGYNDEMKYYWAKAAAYSLNDTIADLELSGGMRLFGNLKVLSPGTSLLCPMQDYSAEKFSRCLDSASPSFGSTPMYEALMAAGDDIAGLQGKTAIIIISDGLSTTASPMEAATILKDKYGDRVCISTITIGTDGSMSGLASGSKCGAAADFDDVKTAEGMTGFVEKVFLEKKQRRVVKPAPAPAPLPVVKEEKIILNSIMFDFDSSAIKPEFAVVLEEAVNILKQKANKSIAIEGHTCSLGSAEYNQGLSERRAAAVKDFLVSKGIAASRLTATGAGEERPIADNTTKDGRKRNRRVELHVMK